MEPMQNALGKLVNGNIALKILNQINLDILYEWKNISILTRLR